MTDLKKYVVMVCGPMDWTQAMFDQYYPSMLERDIMEKNEFIVGGAEGVDRFAQEYLAKQPGIKVTVYDRRMEDNVRFRGVQHVHGFKDFKERDDAMRHAANYVIGKIDQYGGACTSTGQTLLAQELGSMELAEKVKKCLDLNSAKYDSNSRKLSRDPTWRHLYAHRTGYAALLFGSLVLAAAIGFAAGRA